MGGAGWDGTGPDDAVPDRGTSDGGVPDSGGALDRMLLDALFDDTSIGLLIVDAELRVLRAGVSLTGGNEILGSSLEALLPDGAEAVGHLVRACLTSGLPMRVDIDGRALADPDRPRHWTASARPLVSGEADAVAVGCLLVEVPARSG